MSPLNLGSNLNVAVKLGLFSGLSFVLFFTFTSYSGRPRILGSSATYASNSPNDFPFHTRPTGPACSPEDWSAGSWVKRTDAKPVLRPEDVFEVSGFVGCASNREVEWHLANDHPDEYDWRGNASAYEWRPAPHCFVPSDYQESLVTDLVQNGGWLLIGDSVTQEHFFSLSCTLYPHVRATPDYSGDNAYFDRAWPQNLYLRPDSPLVSSLRFPRGFDIDKTPLVTFRRNDLLMNFTEISDLWHIGSPKEVTEKFNSSLWGKEDAWVLSPTEYFDILYAPAPYNYRTLIVSTGGHWSLKLFSGVQGGYQGIFDLFRLVMTQWTYQASQYLESRGNASAEVPKEVVVRPYLPGDDNCHDGEIQDGGPRTHPMSLRWGSYNWEWIPYMNKAFQSAVDERDHPHIHYLDIERPGRLRPDAHVLGDCLHITVGTGVIEGWTQYIQYYVSTYLPTHPKPNGRRGRPEPYRN